MRGVLKLFCRRGWANLLVSVSLLIGLMVSNPAFSAEPTKENVPKSTDNVFKLGEVVVSTEKETKETPSTITVITVEDIERSHATNLGEAFRFIPGMLYRQSRTKNEYYVSLRGFSQENVLILMDGVPIYEPYEGLVNLADIPAQNIAEIKVVKGNASVLYGPNALGGAINIITKKGDTKPNFSASYQISDYNTHHIQATHGWKVGNFSYFIGASHKESDGFKLAEEFSLPADVTTSMYNARTNPLALRNTPIKPDDGKRENSYYDRDAFTFTGSYDITPNHKVGLSVEYYDSEYGVPPVPIYREARARVGGAWGFDYFPRYWRFSEWDRYTINLIEESQLGAHWRIKGRLFYDGYESTLDAYDDDTYSSMNRIGGPPSGRSSYDDYSRGGNFYTFWDGIPRNNIRLGFTFKEDVHRETFAGSPEDRLRSYTYSVGLEDEIRVLEPLTITIGCSYDAFDKRERDQYGQSDETGDDIDALNPMIGFNYVFSPAVNIYGSVAKKVRFPTMRNLYATGVIGPTGDPDLDEERSINYELGGRLAFAKQYLFEAAVFYSRVKDMINFDNQIGRFEQYDKAILAGFEMSLSGQLTSQLFGKLSYTYLNARTDSTVTIENSNTPSLVYEPEELPYRPEHKIDLELSQKFSFGTTIDFNASYVSESTYYDHADPVNRRLVAKKDQLNDYYLCNLKISQDLSHGLQIYIAADNLFDEEYQDIFQLAAPGRTVWAGIKFNL